MYSVFTDLSLVDNCSFALEMIIFLFFLNKKATRRGKILKLKIKTELLFVRIYFIKLGLKKVSFRNRYRLGTGVEVKKSVLVQV